MPFSLFVISDQPEENLSDGDDDREGGGENEKERESLRARHSITKDKINTYIRIQSGLFEGLIGRIMSITGGKCSIRVISEGAYGGRKTSIVSSNYDPDLVATESEKSMIALDLSQIEQKMTFTNPLSLVSSHPANFDFSNKYVRLKSGLYSGTVGRISKYATSSPFSVRILDMPGLKLNRHTTCTPCSIDLELNCNEAELAAVESDRAQMVKLQRKSALAYAPQPSLPAPVHFPVPLLLSSAGTVPVPAGGLSMSALDIQPNTSKNPNPPSLFSTIYPLLTPSSALSLPSIPSSILSSSKPSSSSSSSSTSLVEKKDVHVGKYVRLVGGMFREAVGRVSSQTPKSEPSLPRTTTLSY